MGYILGVGIHASVHVSTCQEHRPLQSFEDWKNKPTRTAGKRDFRMKRICEDEIC